MTRYPWAGLLLAFAVAGCGGDDDDENCANVSGTWTIDGCGVVGCTVAQSGCSISFVCTTVVFGTADFTGTVRGDALSFADNTGGSCEGKFAPQGAGTSDQIFGTCTSETGICEWDGFRQ